MGCPHRLVRRRSPKHCDGTDGYVVRHPDNGKTHRQAVSRIGALCMAQAIRLDSGGRVVALLVMQPFFPSEPPWCQWWWL